MNSSNNDEELPSSEQDIAILYTNFPTHELFLATTTMTLNKKRLIYPNSETNKSSSSSSSTCSRRFADFEVDTIHKRVYCICEDHDNAVPTPDGVVNTLVSISLEDGSLQVIAQGNDFYSTPVLSPDGTMLAYVTWNHPSMPWDCTEIRVQKLTPDDGSCDGEAILVHGNIDASLEDGMSALQPLWSPDNVLHYLSDVTGWYNLFTWARDGSSNAVYKLDAEFSSASQGWVLGETPYCFLSDGRLVATYKAEDGTRLIVGTRKKGDGAALYDIAEFGRGNLPPTSISNLCCTKTDNTLYFIGGSATEPASIWKWEDPGNPNSIATLALPSIEPTTIAPFRPFISKPQPITFPGKHGTCHAYYYPPTNLAESANLPSNFKPPLLVRAHGGPTSQTSSTFRLDIQFWTSRGFAVLDVDYGGSSGYGRLYRQRLNGKWGIVDMDDCCSGAEWCVQNSLADGAKLCIDGGSAGGYTTLCALTFRTTFSAGASKYGISDLAALYVDTHKFESRYMDRLIGPLNDEFRPVYEARCPIRYTDQLDCPILLLQGDEDRVVPMNQAEMMFAALKEKGIPTALVVYKGEQHGFRKSENVCHCLNAEYVFFCRAFGLQAMACGDADADADEILVMGERMER